MILLWQHNGFIEQVPSLFPLGVSYGLSQNRPNPIHFSPLPRSLLALTSASQSVNRFAATNVPIFALALSPTFLFLVSFSQHDIVATFTFLHRFMHRLPRLLMNARFMLILSPSVPRCLPHRSLASFPFPISPSLRITPYQIPLPLLSVPLYSIFIRWFFVRSRSVYVHICIDPHASNPSLPIRVIRPMFYPSLIFLPPQSTSHVCVSGCRFSASRSTFHSSTFMSM